MIITKRSETETSVMLEREELILLLLALRKDTSVQEATQVVDAVLGKGG